MALGGGICGICRTLDRLVALVRGPEFPVSAGTETLLRLRSWTSELQDYSEALRGVAPCATGVGSAAPVVVPALVRVPDIAPGAVGKAAGPRPPEVSGAVIPKQEKTVKDEGEAPEEAKTEAGDTPGKRSRRRRRSSLQDQPKESLQRASPGVPGKKEKLRRRGHHQKETKPSRPTSGSWVPESLTFPRQQS